MNIYFTFVSFVFGIILGSFYNVCIYRIPLKKSIVSPPSSCTNCGNRLNIVDLVPVFSWIFLKGKCRFCGNEVSSRYISIELLTGVIFVLVFLVFGYNISTIYYMIFSSILIVITFIDIDHLIIPDRIVIFGILCSFIFSLCGVGIDLTEWFFGLSILFFAMLSFVYFIEIIIKKEFMGGGDIKFFAMVGTFLGVRIGILTIIISMYIGAFYGIIIITKSKLVKKDYESMIPYGPFISIASFICMIFGNDILNWYMNLF